MFPLQDRILIRGAAAHVRAKLGIGADYRANYVPFFIPFDGKVETYWGNEGGNWLRLIRPNGDRIELAHLSHYSVTKGNVKAGQLGGITGNSGAITDYAHLHIQIFNKAGKRLDPETYDWGKEKMEVQPQYIEQDGKIGFMFDYGQFTVIHWATDEKFGDVLSKHYKPGGQVLKIVKK